MQKDDNPFLAVNVESRPADTDKAVSVSRYPILLTLFAAYAGTVLAGGFFGLIAGITGVIIGLVLASVVGAVVFLIVGAILLLIWPQISPLGLAVLLGGLTGFLAMTSPFLLEAYKFDPQHMLNVFLFAIVPAGLGGLGALLGACSAAAIQSRRLE